MRKDVSELKKFQNEIQEKKKEIQSLKEKLEEAQKSFDEAIKKVEVKPLKDLNEYINYGNELIRKKRGEKNEK